MVYFCDSPTAALQTLSFTMVEGLIFYTYRLACIGLGLSVVITGCLILSTVKIRALFHEPTARSVADMARAKIMTYLLSIRTVKKGK